MNARTPIRHIDGTNVFQTDEDKRRERAVAVRLEKAWDCTIDKFAELSTVDWYAVRDDRMGAVMETFP